MTKSKQDLQQDALQDMLSEKDTGRGAGASAAASRTDTGLPTVDFSLPPTPVRGTPSTDVPKTRKTILQDMEQRLLEHERNDIDAGDRTLDDGTHQVILDTLRTNWDDSNDETDVLNLPNYPIPPKSLTRGCTNFSPPQNSPPKSDCAQTQQGIHFGDGSFHFGGYDGGFTVGLEGEYRDGCLERLRQKLDDAQENAKENRKEGKYHFDWLGYNITIDARSVTEGVMFKYQLWVDGVRVLIRDKATRGYQSIRVRFSAESLMANSARANWHHILAFFNAIGFIVTKDCVSRVDFHLTSDFLTMADVKWFFENDYIVSKLLTYAEHGKGLGSKRRVEYIRFGTGINPVQFYFYDKKVELDSGGNSFTQKYVMTQEKIGDEWRNSGRPVTRFEISVKRVGLRAMGINCVDDLFGNEWAIINLLTHSWIRILDTSKKKGNEWKQNNHPVWDKIRNALYQHFGGKNFADKAEWNPPEPVAGNPEHLEKMALGCLSKALALRNGEQSNKQSSMNLANVWVDKNGKDLHYKINQTAVHTVNKTGIPLGLRVEESWETLDSTVLDRSRKQANTWLTSVPTTPLFPVNVADVPSEPSPVRGNGAALDLDGVTGRERFGDFMDKAKPFYKRE